MAGRSLHYRAHLLVRISWRATLLQHVVRRCRRLLSCCRHRAVSSCCRLRAFKSHRVTADILAARSRAARARPAATEQALLHPRSSAAAASTVFFCLSPAALARIFDREACSVGPAPLACVAASHQHGAVQRGEMRTIVHSQLSKLVTWLYSWRVIWSHATSSRASSSGRHRTARIHMQLLTMGAIALLGTQHPLGHRAPPAGTTRRPALGPPVRRCKRFSTCAFEDKAATVGDTLWLAQQSLNGPVDAAPLSVQALNCSAPSIGAARHLVLSRTCTLSPFTHSTFKTPSRVSTIRCAAGRPAGGGRSRRIPMYKYDMAVNLDAMRVCYLRVESSLVDSDLLSASGQSFQFVEIFEEVLRQMCDQAGIQHQYDATTATTGYHMHLAECLEKLIQADASLCNAFPSDAVDALTRLIRFGRNPFKRQLYIVQAVHSHPMPPDIYRRAMGTNVEIMRDNVRALKLYSAMASFRKTKYFGIDLNTMATLGGTIFRLNTIIAEIEDHYDLSDRSDPSDTQTGIRIAYCKNQVLKISRRWQYFSSHRQAELVRNQWPIGYRLFVFKDVLRACTAIEVLYRWLPDDDSCWSRRTSGPTQKVKTVSPRTSVDEYLQVSNQRDLPGCRSDMKILIKVLQMYIEIKP